MPMKALPQRTRPREKMDALLAFSHEIAKRQVVAEGVGYLDGELHAVIKVAGEQVTGPIKGKKNIQAVLCSHYLTFSRAIRHVESYLREMEREGRL
jgi:hypothetical protein